MYNIYINGKGAELTQGALPIDIVEHIKAETEGSSLSSYFFDTLDADDRINWFDVDDNFHSYGAWLYDSELCVEDSKGNIIFKELCYKLKFILSHTKELYPEDFKFEPIGVLTCTEQLEGKFCITELDTNSFDANKICIHVDTLGDIAIVSHISYDDSEFKFPESEVVSKDFIVNLEN